MQAVKNAALRNSSANLVNDAMTKKSFKIPVEGIGLE
jgi:hypothetical protein